VLTHVTDVSFARQVALLESLLQGGCEPVEIGFPTPANLGMALLNFQEQPQGVQKGLGKQSFLLAG